MNIRLYDVVGFYVMLSFIPISVAILIFQSAALTVLTFMSTVAGIVYLQVRDSEDGAAWSGPKTAS